MAEILSAFKNPAWWILTVIASLFLNVIAPFINRWIEKIWSSYSNKKAMENKVREEVIEAYVDSKRKKDTGVLEAKMDAIYWAIRVVIVCCISILLVQLPFLFPGPLPRLVAIPISLISFFVIIRRWKNWRLAAKIHNALHKGVGIEESDL